MRSPTAWGSLRRSGNPLLVFTATIGEDGTFNAHIGPDSMSGRISGGIMQGQIIGDICAFTFNAARGGIS